MLVDLVAPHAVDRRRERFVVLAPRRVERRRRASRAPRGSVAGGQRQAPVGLQRAKELRLHLVEQSCRASADPCAPAARARPAARGGRSSRAGTGTGRSRTAAAPTANTDARASRCAASAAWSCRCDADQAVARRPRPIAAARPAADDRSAQRLVEAEQVVRVASAPTPARARRAAACSDREIVLEIVDGARRLAPAPARRGSRRPRRGALRREHAVVGHAAGDRAHDVERVERRHARRASPRRRAADTTDTAARSRRRSRVFSSSRSALPRSSCVDERGVERAARLSSSSSGSSRGRCGNDPLGEARHEHDAERCGRAPGAACRRTRGRSAAPAAPVERDAADRAARRAPPRASPARSSAIGRRSASVCSTRAGRRSAVGASAAKRSSHSPHVAPSRPRASTSMIGSANARRCAEVAADRARSRRCAANPARRAQLLDR